MRNLLLACLFLTGCIVVSHPARHVAGSGWVELGDRWVQGHDDHDAIHVGRADGRFTRLQIAVDHSALEMDDVVVTFGDGQVWSPPTRLVFDAGTSTRQLDLPGGARAIRRVDFRYGNLPGGGRAHVVVYGL